MKIIINDPGGYIWQHIAIGQHYAQIGAKLIIVYCASACLNLLAQVPASNVCFRPSAWIGYHVHQQADGYEPTTSMRWERGRDWIAKGWASCAP